MIGYMLLNLLWGLPAHLPTQIGVSLIRVVVRFSALTRVPRQRDEADRKASPPLLIQADVNNISTVNNCPQPET